MAGSCKYFKKSTSEESGKMVARVFDKQLPLGKVLHSLPKDTKGKDSVAFIKNYINNWIQLELIIHKAEQNLNDDQKDVEQQLENYRNSLIIYAYEKELVRQKLDTNVTETEIEKYYQDNTRNFELKDNIVKVIYVKVNKSAPNMHKLKDWYKLSKTNDRKQLESYCHQFAENFYLDEESWLLFDDVLKEIPIKTYNQEQFLQNNRLIEMQDSAYNYFVNIVGFKVKESISPLSFERNNIRSIIVNKRKLKLIEQMRKDIYQDALKKTDFEIYN